MQVFLIGFMGVGKTSLGKRLANRLNLPFEDLDQTIEDQEGMTVQQIFSDKGEDYFRDIERQWVLSQGKDSKVYSLGGGTPCTDENIAALLSQGICIFLNMDVNIIASRLSQAKNKRPLIEKYEDDREGLVSFIEAKLKERRRYYLQAPIIFNCSDVKADNLELLADLIEIKEKYRS